MFKYITEIKYIYLLGVLSLFFFGDWSGYTFETFAGGAIRIICLVISLVLFGVLQWVDKQVKAENNEGGR